MAAPSLLEALRRQIDRSSIFTIEGVVVFDGKRDTTRLVVNAETGTAIASHGSRRATVVHPESYTVAALRAIAALKP